MIMQVLCLVKLKLRCTEYNGDINIKYHALYCYLLEHIFNLSLVLLLCKIYFSGNVCRENAHLFLDSTFKDI